MNAYTLSQSCMGWKVIAPNGRTVFRRSGPRAQRACVRWARNGGRS